MRYRFAAPGSHLVEHFGTDLILSRSWPASSSSSIWYQIVRPGTARAFKNGTKLLAHPYVFWYHKAIQTNAKGFKMVPVKLAALHRFLSELLVNHPYASETLDDYVEDVKTGLEPRRLWDFLRGLYVAGCWDADRNEDVYDLFVAAFPGVF